MRMLALSVGGACRSGSVRGTSVASVTASEPEETASGSTRLSLAQVFASLQGELLLSRDWFGRRTHARQDPGIPGTVPGLQTAPLRPEPNAHCAFLDWKWPEGRREVSSRVRAETRISAEGRNRDSAEWQPQQHPHSASHAALRPDATTRAPCPRRRDIRLDCRVDAAPRLRPIDRRLPLRR